MIRSSLPSFKHSSIGLTIWLPISWSYIWTMRLPSTSKENTSWTLGMLSRLNTSNLSILLSSRGQERSIKVRMHYEGDISFYFNSTLICLGLSILSPCTRVIWTLVSFFKHANFDQREISCFKEVILSSEQDYVCLNTKPRSSSLGKFMKDP